MAKTNGTRKITRLKDLKPDRHNANRHTERGSGMMKNSIRESGFGDSLTVDKDGVVISGNQRLETLADIQMDNPIVIQSDGTRPIVHQRTDLKASDKRGRMLALYSNRVGELNLNWSAEQLKALSNDVELSRLWTDEELSLLLENSKGETQTNPYVQIVERFAVLIECASEDHQAKMLNRFTKEGLKCRALCS